MNIATIQLFGPSLTTRLAIGSTGQVLTVSGGGVPTWQAPATNFWQELTGALSPTQNSDDLLIGGISTSSALFSYTGIKTGQTIASVSGNLIVMSNNGYGGQVGIGYTNPGTAALAVNGRIGVGINTPIGLLNVSGNSTGQALANFNYTGSGQNILTASASGSTVFTLDGFGNLNVTGIVSENNSALLINPMTSPGDMIYNGSYGSDLAVLHGIASSNIGTSGHVGIVCH